MADRDPHGGRADRRVKIVGRTDSAPAGDGRAPADRSANDDYGGYTGRPTGQAAYGLAEGGAVVYHAELTFQSWRERTVTLAMSHAIRTQIAAHSSLSNQHGREIAGLIVGFAREEEGRQRIAVTPTDLIPFPEYDASEAHVTIPAGMWAEVDRVFDQNFAGSGKDRLGWYHTHPTQGILFSNRDRDFHSVFTRDFQFALVVDPQRMECGLYHWTDERRTTLPHPIRFHLPVPPAPRHDGRGTRPPPLPNQTTSSYPTFGMATEPRPARDDVRRPPPRPRESKRKISGDVFTLPFVLLLGILLSLMVAPFGFLGIMLILGIIAAAFMVLTLMSLMQSDAPAVSSAHSAGDDSSSRIDREPSEDAGSGQR